MVFLMVTAHDSDGKKCRITHHCDGTNSLGNVDFSVLAEFLGKMFMYVLEEKRI